MKKCFVILLLIVIVISLNSCEIAKKNFSSMTTYKDPQMVGGYWNVTMQTGQTFNHVKCTYWGTDDDTAVFQLDDGKIICQSGACVCIYVGDK